jgi:hypothetical protein
MALRLSCYGDISAAAANNYQLSKLFTPELKTAVRKCGSSSVLTTLMAEIFGVGAEGGDAETEPERAPPRVGAGAGGDGRRGAVLGPVLGGMAALGSAVGASVGSREQQQHRLGDAAAAAGGGGGGVAECASCCAERQTGQSLVEDLRALAVMHSDGLLEVEEYSLAKHRVLASRRR